MVQRRPRRILREDARVFVRRRRWSAINHNIRRKTQIVNIKRRPKKKKKTCTLVLYQLPVLQGNVLNAVFVFGKNEVIVSIYYYDSLYYSNTV